MKILMLNASFSCSGYTHGLCNALADAGCHVELYTGPYYLVASRNWERVAYQPRIRFYRLTQMRSYTIRPMRALWRLLRLLGHVWSMTRIIFDAHRFDVVHVQYLSVRSLDVWWLRVIGWRTPVVYTVHNLYPHDTPRRGRMHRLFRRIYGQSVALLAHSDATVEALSRRFGVPREKITKVAHGNMNYLRTQRDAPKPADLGLDRHHAPLVLMFGVLRHDKGPDVLLHAASLLRDDGVDFRLLLAGVPGVDPKPYYELASELGLDGWVEFRMHYIEEEEVAAYFQAATVVALPYREIDQSGVLISALSLGRAIVATRLAGLEEVINESHAGLLVPVDDPQGMAQAIKQLLTDESLRRRCEASALRYADTVLAWEPIAQQTIEVYHRVQGDS